MKVDTINIQRAYGTPGSSNPIKKTNTSAGIQPAGKINNDRNSYESLANSSKLITSSERKFFVNMFPENSKQIMTHEVFTRNGRVKESQVQKGSIFDGRI